MTVKVEAVKVAGAMSSLNVAVIRVLVATFAAPGCRHRQHHGRPRRVAGRAGPCAERRRAENRIEAAAAASGDEGDDDAGQQSNRQSVQVLERVHVSFLRHGRATRCAWKARVVRALARTNRGTGEWTANERTRSPVPCERADSLG
jgi:hypothetical protein